TAGKDTDRAIGGFEAVLYMEWFSGGALFVLGKGHAVVSIIITLRAHVTVPGERATLEDLRQQPVGASDGCVGVIVRSHSSGPGVHTDLVADRAIDYDHGSHRAGGVATRADSARSQGKNHRKILR